MPIYVAARDLNGVPIGTHQFIIVTYPTAQSVSIGKHVYVAKKIGPKTYGIVVGAHNNGHLNIKVFEDADLTAAKEYFGSNKTVWHKSDYDTEVQLVTFSGSASTLQAEQTLYSLIDAFITNQIMDPISYPTAGLGYNCNSWTQSVIKYIGGKARANMSGFDLYHDQLIPKTYFTPFCPIKARVKLN